MNKITSLITVCSIITCGYASVHGENATLGIRLPEWKLANAVVAGYGTGSITEYVKENKMITNWSKLLTVEFIVNKRETPLCFIEKLGDQMFESYNLTESNIPEKNETSVSYDWGASNYEPHPNQHEIARNMISNDELHRISFTKKVNEIAPELLQDYVKKCGTRIQLLR
jgi:hypothetical protein